MLRTKHLRVSFVFIIYGKQIFEPWLFGQYQDINSSKIRQWQLTFKTTKEHCPKQPTRCKIRLFTKPHCDLKLYSLSALPLTAIISTASIQRSLLLLDLHMYFFLWITFYANPTNNLFEWLTCVHPSGFHFPRHAWSRHTATHSHCTQCLL